MGDIQLSDIAALLGNRDNNGSAFGDEGVLLLFIILLFGGWGRGYGNQGSGYGAGGVGGNELYPWLNQSEQVNDGFRDQMINGSINGIQQSVTNGFANVQQSLCSGFAGVNQGMANGFNQTQVAMLQGFNGLQAQQAQCCCDNQLAMANQTAALLAEHCADRNALSQAVNTITTNETAGFQRIIDKMCDQELQAERRENDNLRQQINMMNLAASQAQQTQQLLADNFAQTSALEQYLAPVPRPAYIVQNPNCCGQQFYGGCGCAA